MSEHIKLAENIILIDVPGLNETIINLVRFFEGSISRKLNKVDLETWIIDLALDAGLREGEHRTQILFVYDDTASFLEYCTTRELKSVDGWGCRNQFGEFIFSAISSEGLASRESVFFDLLQITLNSEDVKRLILLPAENEYGERLHGCRKFQERIFALSPEAVLYSVSPIGRYRRCRGFGSGGLSETLGET